MKKTLFSLLCGAALLSAGLGASAAEPVAYSAQKLQSLQAQGKTVLVDVYASWCPTCRAQTPVLDKLLKEKQFAQVTALRLDWDAQREDARAMGAPRQSTLFLYRGGHKVATSVAETREALLRAFLAQGVK